MRIPPFIPVLMLLLATMPAAATESCLPEARGPVDLQISAPAADAWSPPVPASLFGASPLYHIDDDAFWGNAETPALIQDLNITALRFPGGELSDNYDWKAHRLLRAKDFPREAKNDAARAARTDYREFLEAARRIGVTELSFVVGVDAAFREGGDIEANITRHAQHAAAWVKAVRESGHFVPYWEIGNEAYGAGGYPLSAAEYARVLRTYSTLMRQADPRIRIGAVGPGGSVNPGRDFSFADRIDSEALRELRGHQPPTIKSACGKLRTSECIGKLLRGRPAPKQPAEWWTTVLGEAGASFDFAVIHRYDRTNLKAAGRKSAFMPTVRIQELKKRLSGETGRDIRIALTEWNTPSEKRHGQLTEMEHLGEIAMQTGMNAAAGLDMAMYWPMRGKLPGFRPLITASDEPTSAGRLLGVLGRQLTGARVYQGASTQDMYVLQAIREDEHVLVLVNTAGRSQTLDWQHEAGQSVTVMRTRPVPGSSIRLASCGLDAGAGSALRFAVPPQTLVILTAKR